MANNRLSPALRPVRAFYSDEDDSTLTEIALPEQLQFLRNWFEHDTELSGTRLGFNWGAVAGLVLVVGISGGFWTALGLVAARLWR